MPQNNNNKNLVNIGSAISENTKLQHPLLVFGKWTEGSICELLVISDIICFITVAEIQGIILVWACSETKKYEHLLNLKELDLWHLGGPVVPFYRQENQRQSKATKPCSLKQCSGAQACNGSP